MKFLGLFLHHTLPASAVPPARLRAASADPVGLPVLNIGSTRMIVPHTGLMGSYVFTSDSVAAQPFGATSYPRPQFLQGYGSPGMVTQDNAGTQLTGGSCSNRGAAASGNAAALLQLVGGG